jgi:hypothetical protein
MYARLSLTNKDFIYLYLSIYLFIVFHVKVNGVAAG